MEALCSRMNASMTKCGMHDGERRDPEESWPETYSVRVRYPPEERTACKLPRITVMISSHFGQNCSILNSTGIPWVSSVEIIKLLPSQASDKVYKFRDHKLYSPKPLKPSHPFQLGAGSTVGALIIRIGFWDILYQHYNKEPLE